MMLRNLTVLTLTALIAITPLTYAQSVITTVPFVDIHADYDFRNAVQFLKDKKIVSGYPDMTYKPDVPVTRAEFLKMAIRLSGRSLDATTLSKLKSPFSDVVLNDWFYADVMSAHKLGIAQGIGGGKFGPHQLVTRAEALKLAFLTMQLAPTFAPKNMSELAAARDTLPPDISFSSWFYTYAMTARKLFIMTDSDAGPFYPHAPVNRGMAAEILYRISQVKASGGSTPFDISQEWNIMEAPGLGLTLKTPKTWSTATEGGRIAIWKKDATFPLNHELVTPLTANITFISAAPEASKTSSAYFENLKALNSKAYPGKEISYTNVNVSGSPALHVKLPQEGIENWFVYIPASSGLAEAKSVSIYGKYGMGTLMPKLRETLRTMVRTLEISPVTSAGPGSVSVPDETLRSAIQSNVLVAKVGKMIINSLGDALIIETDEIGVGTGPVDYYYTAKLQMTLKYERASDTILATRNSKTTSF